MKKVLITGAEGVIGTALRERWQGRYTLSALTRFPAPFPSHAADIADLEAILPAFEDIDAVVHLAGSPDVDTPWEDVLHNNIVGTRNVYEAARLKGVGTVVFASSNHAIGMYEKDAAPGLYALDDTRVWDASVPVRPDSYYGAAKVFSEALGRYYSDAYGLRVICVRIGTVRADDDPCSPDVARSSGWLDLRGKEKYERLRATWLSKDDCAQLLGLCIDAEAVKYAVVYGISDNPRQFWDLSEARELLGYEPQSRAPMECPPME